MKHSALLRPGAVVGVDFRVIAPLDEGGMGVVYRVEQLSTGEERALKVLRPSLLGDARSRERFAQEALLGARVASDHVVSMIGAGVDDETGVPWIAMELLRGENLRASVRAHGPMAPAEVLVVMRELSHALGAAHRAGVVHRDLKPENVFLATPRGPTPRRAVKLLDFGLARVLQEFETSVTPTAVMGSPLWMAPEQVRREKIRPATDVWALGLLAFWMLTGTYYWLAARGESASPEAVLHEKLYEPLVPASRRARALVPTLTLPRGFDAWFRRCVARDPSERFRDADSAFAALAPVLEHPATRLEPRVGTLLLGGTLATLALVGGVYAARNARPDAPHARAHEALDAGASDRDVHAPLALPSATPVREPARARVTPHSTPAARPTASPLRVPAVPGYAIAQRPDLASVCGAGEGRAFAATPSWYPEARADLARRERTARLEAQMAARLSSGAERARLEAHVQEETRSLGLAREALGRRASGELRDARARDASLAQHAGCASRGVRAGGDEGLFHLWCCP